MPSRWTARPSTTTSKAAPVPRARRAGSGDVRPVRLVVPLFFAAAAVYVVAQATMPATDPGVEPVRSVCERGSSTAHTAGRESWC